MVRIFFHVLTVVVVLFSIGSFIYADQSTPVFGMVPVNINPSGGSTATPSVMPSASSDDGQASSATDAPSASCEFSLSKNRIDTSIDLQANANRVTVFGSASGTGFGYSNYVQINCNSGNTQPYFGSTTLKAHNTVLSESSLSYTGYCSYPTGQTDSSYTVSAKLMPDNVDCTPTTDAGVSVTASGQTPEPSAMPAATASGCGNAGQKRCDLSICKTAPAPDYCEYYGCNPPSVSDGNMNGDCIACPVGTSYDSGRCFSEANPPTPSAAPSSSEQQMPFSLQFKWTLFGVPFGQVINAEHSCVSNAYYFDPESNEYVKVSDFTDPDLVGKGLWLERSSMGGDCRIQFTGTYLESQTIQLTQGWNLVSIQTAKSLDTTQNQNCQIVKGPFTYSGFISNGKPYGYYARDRLDNGNGYWIKVAQDCTLSTNTDDVPPAPPA